MNLNDLLTKKKSEVLNTWLDKLMESYSADARRFFRKQKDPFANPVGTTLKRELENLYDFLLKEWDTNQISSIMDRIIRVRAIQDFTPSQALSFVFDLKTIIREKLKKEIISYDLQDEVLKIEIVIDRMALLGFDVYSNCRQRLYEVRVNEVKKQISGFLRKAGIGIDFEQPKQELNETIKDNL